MAITRNIFDSRIKDLSNRGYTIAEIADDIGFSMSTVSEYIKSE